MAMSDQQTKRMNEAAQKVVEATLESYGTVWDHFGEAQERQTRLSHDFFRGTLSNLRIQTERNLDVVEELIRQARRGQEASQVLAQESADAYTDFLDSLFRYYRESAKAAEKSTMKG